MGCDAGERHDLKEALNKSKKSIKEKQLLNHLFSAHGNNLGGGLSGPFVRAPARPDPSAAVSGIKNTVKNGFAAAFARSADREFDALPRKP